MAKLDINDIRAMIAIRFPLFINFLVDVPFVEDNSQSTLRTNGKKILYNREFLETRTPGDQLFMFLHELGHNFMGHHLRYHKDWDDDTQQAAMDIAINSLLIASDLPRPADALYSIFWKDLAFEEIYRLMEQKQEKQQNTPKHDPNKHGKVEESPELSGDDEQTDDPLTENGDKKEQKRQELIDKHTEKQQEAVQQAMMMGSLTDSAKVMLEKLSKSDMNWRDVFCELLTVCIGSDDFTYTRPNKRSEDIILPTMYSERGPIVSFFGDTSGSVSLKEIKAMAESIVSLMEDVTPEQLHVLWTDTKVQSYELFEEDDEVTLEPKGRGGTDFRPPFEYLEKHDIQPDVVVYMTDGGCSRFPEPPSYPVIWMVWQDRRPFNPPFGEVVLFNYKKR